MAASKIKETDRFGRWTVLGPMMLTDKGERKWLCQCDCGTQRYVLERSLLHGGSASCGCLRKERVAQTHSPDLTGKQFGELTVIGRAPKNKHGAIQWICRCSCGEACTVQTSPLMTGRKTRCTGRCHQKNYAFVDITGQRFGRLVALYPSRRYDKSGSVIWRCHCDCGSDVDLSYNALAYSRQKSCGCQKAENNQKLQTYLTHLDGTSIDMLRSKKIPSDNTTGYRGVYYIRGKYVAKIVFQKKQYFLGCYDDILDAAQARKEAEALLFDGVAAHYQKWKRQADADPEWAEDNPVRIIVTRKNKQLQVTLHPAL